MTTIITMYVQYSVRVVQVLTMFAVDIGPHMHMDSELVAEALRTYFLSKVRLGNDLKLLWNICSFVQIL